MNRNELSHETWWLRFDWQVRSIVTMSRNGQNKQRQYAVFRRRRIFGIPLWWTWTWNRNSCDGVNLNSRIHDTVAGAMAQLELERILRDYDNQKIEEASK